MKTSAQPTSPTASISLRLDDQFCFALYSAALGLNRIYRPLLAPLGLTYSQYLVMLVLWEQDDLMVSEIGAKLYLDSATLTPLLKRMQTQGLISRARGRVDERQVIISLTQEGRQLKRQAAEMPLKLLQSSGCSIEEIGSLKEGLEAFREKLVAVEC
ncbi:MAG: MarR family transcriptional regulator [Burkholderiaceae bacterium]|jgi:DNA-binding MarR family transcriptional regulator